jgi:hypothetical protein
MQFRQPDISPDLITSILRNKVKPKEEIRKMQAASSALIYSSEMYGSL